MDLKNSLLTCNVYFFLVLTVFSCIFRIVTLLLRYLFDIIKLIWFENLNRVFCKEWKLWNQVELDEDFARKGTCWAAVKYTAWWTAAQMNWFHAVLLCSSHQTIGCLQRIPDQVQFLCWCDFFRCQGQSIHCGRPDTPRIRWAITSNRLKSTFYKQQI